MHYILKILLLLIIVCIAVITYLFVTKKLNWDDMLQLLEENYIAGYTEVMRIPTSGAKTPTSGAETPTPTSGAETPKKETQSGPKFIEGNLNWKFTSELDDIDCLRGWDYFKTDGSTLIKSDIPIATYINKTNRWCATKDNTLPTDRIPADERMGIVKFLDDYKGELAGVAAAVALDILYSKFSDAGKRLLQLNVAAKLKTELAEKLAREAIEELTETTTTSVTRTIKESTERAIVDITERATREATEKALSGVSKELVSESTERLLKTAVTNAVEEVSERLIRDAIEKAAREGISQATLDLTVKLIRDTAKKSLATSVNTLVKNTTSTIATKSLKIANKSFLKTSIPNLAKLKAIPKMAFRYQSKALLSISKTLFKNGDSIAKITRALTGLAKSSGKISGKLGIKTSTKILSIAKRFKPGPFALFDILSLALDVADVAGFGDMQTKKELYQQKSESDYEEKKNMYKSIKNALYSLGIEFKLDDFEWPIVIDPTEDILDENELEDRIVLKLTEILATARTPNQDPIINAFITAMDSDIENDKIAESGPTDAQIDRYVDLIDMDAIFKQINNELCNEEGGLIYDGDKCTLKKEDCDKSYSWPITDDDIYAEFKNGKCVQANPQMREICDELKLPYDQNTGICKIDSEYCLSKGASMKYDKDLKEDDCYVSTEQKAIEIIFGETFTRGLLYTAKKALDVAAQPIDQTINQAMWGVFDGITDADTKQIIVPGEIKIKGKCLDVKHSKQPKLQIWDCNGTQNQKFLYDDISKRIMFLGKIEKNPLNDTYCVEAANKNNGTQLFLNKCSDSGKQNFDHRNSELRHSHTVSKYGWGNDENTLIEAPYSCIDLINDNPANGNNFQLLGCTGNDAQKFIMGTKKVHIDTAPPRFKINYNGFK